ncbi:MULTISPECIES: glycoside hydrolase family 25 protein [Clostridia]|uniref:GH25 family lysozyme n=1 Tax=Clostridia TaxID=186801 RepID=UPI0015F93537|nr:MULTISPECIES: glycoside hydrolase family 25 protein [Clostridia]
MKTRIKLLTLLLCGLLITSVVSVNAEESYKAGSIENDVGTSFSIDDPQKENLQENEAHDKEESDKTRKRNFQENSWRYQNGEKISKPNGVARNYDTKAWTKVNGYYVNDIGERIPGAVKKGIDVSEHQGIIDWNGVKSSGIEFAIIRCGYGDDKPEWDEGMNQDDNYWERNVNECERLGIPYGVYLYSYAQTVEQAKSEAQHVLRLINGRTLSYPVFLDMEDNSTINLDKTLKGNIAKVFCETVSASGYSVGIYANLDWWDNYLTDSAFSNNSWFKWVAQYNSTCDYQGTYNMWQCTDTGQVEGISGGTDINFWMEEKVTPPSAVKDLKAVSLGKQRVSLSWSASVGAEGYLIYAQKNGKYGYVGMTTKGTTYTDTKALDTAYNFYWVFPYVKNTAGKMIPGSCTKYVYAKGVCHAVTNLRAASVKGGVRLTWNISSGAEGYLVYGQRTGGKYGYIGMTTRGTTYTDMKALKEQFNFYWVYPYHKDDKGKMIVGGTPKYTYGKAL